MKKAIMLFLFGGFSYGLIEVCYRGYSHFSMVIAGGIAFLLFSRINLIKIPLLYKCVLGSLAVTLIELVFGIVFNLWLNQNVWDYSEIRFNFLGQICVLFSVVWGGISLVAVPLSGTLSNYITKKGRA